MSDILGWKNAQCCNCQRHITHMPVPLLQDTVCISQPYVILTRAGCTAQKQSTPKLVLGRCIRFAHKTITMASLLLRVDQASMHHLRAMHLPSSVRRTCSAAHAEAVPANTAAVGPALGATVAFWLLLAARPRRRWGGRAARARRARRAPATRGVPSSSPPGAAPLVLQRRRQVGVQRRVLATTARRAPGARRRRRRRAAAPGQAPMRPAPRSH